MIFFNYKLAYVTGEWKTLHKKNSSPNIIPVIESRKLRWVGHVARMGEEMCIQEFGGET
jgi:hypothetical protein